MRLKLELLRRRCCFLPRVLAAMLAFTVLCGCMLLMQQDMNLVTVTDDGTGEQTVLLTDVRTAHEIVQLAGLSTTKHDRVIHTVNADNSASVVIQRAFPVTLVADGSTYPAELIGGTVADLLEACGVELGPEDYVQPAVDTPLYEGLAATVHRVTYKEEQRRETPEEELVNSYAAGLAEDTVFVRSYNGEYDVLYRDRYLDGVLQSSEIVEMAPVMSPRPQNSYEILEGVPCSRILGYDDVKFGADGKPLEYTSLWEGAVCTAYSSSGGMGASGLGLYCGTVAVNPNVIPYGTRMYITSADGGFVYGFAIATDTGTAMMEGHVGLDLYFETNSECYWFGKRQLNVYFFD